MTQGGRIELRLERVDAERARYRVELASNEGSFVGGAEVTLENGDVVIRVEPEPPA